MNEAFNVIDIHEDPVTLEKRHVYGRYIGDTLWCVWYPTPNSKAADEALRAKADATREGGS